MGSAGKSSGASSHALHAVALLLVLVVSSVVLTGQARRSVFGSSSFVSQAVKPIVDCKSLLGVDLSGIADDGSAIVTSAGETVRSGVRYCAVEGKLPASTTWQVLLPTSTWTQRYMQVGCGGLCGKIRMEVSAAAGSARVDGGEFVLGATDMGGGMDGTVFAHSPERRKSFAHSAQHLTSLVSKTLMRAYYGQNPQHSYFNGCSDGGREGVMEAIRYPHDFDGIIAGAPAMLFQFQNSLHHGWLAASNTPDTLAQERGDTAVLLASKLPVLHAAVMRACDALDSLEDGLLSDPRLCHFDPRELQCEADAATDVERKMEESQRHCLTAPEVETIVKIYGGPMDLATERHLTVGDTQFGSELGWEGVFVPKKQGGRILSRMISLAALRYLIFEPNPPPTYQLSDLHFTEETVNELRARHPLFDATSPDLEAFKAAGGKLILWHGWADQHISPRTTVAYHEALEHQMGGPTAVADFERLYMLPGVEHCGGGEGMAVIDLVTPMLEWVEVGNAPHEVITKSEPAPWFRAPFVGSRSRPVYPYPSLAKYSGDGDVNAAPSYVEGEPLYTSLTRAWAGQDFFEPYVPRQE